MIVTRPERIERATAAAGSIALQGLLIYALLVGLSVHVAPGADEVMKVFNLAPPPPRPPEQRHERQRLKSSKRSGAASPRNIRSKATEIASPPPQVPLPVPSPVVAAPRPYIGRSASTGASNLPGPGTGAGGHGNGSGDEGNGEGEGEGSPPLHRSGRIKNSDYPRAAWEVGAKGTVTVIFRVQTNGRVTDCEVTRSSGNASLDQTTCQLIEQRFRYEPARDGEGRRVASRLIENHTWDMDIERSPDEGQPPPR